MNETFWDELEDFDQEIFDVDSDSDLDFDEDYIEDETLSAFLNSSWDF